MPTILHFQHWFKLFFVFLFLHVLYCSIPLFLLYLPSSLNHCFVLAHIHNTVYRVDLQHSIHTARCGSISYIFNFSYSGYVETCYSESQSHARSLGWVPSGGNRDRALYSIQVSDFEALWMVNLLFKEWRFESNKRQHMSSVGEAGWNL